MNYEGIGGSDIPAIIGVNPYKTAYQLWLEKTGQAPATQDNKYMRAGRKLEQVVAEFFSEETAAKVIPSPGPVLIDGWMRASVDRLYIRNPQEQEILECKTTQKTHDVPDPAWLAQLHWYFHLLKKNHGAIAWLEKGVDFKYYFIDADEDFIRYITQLAHEFWFKNVLEKIRPEPQNLGDVELMFRTATTGKVIEVQELEEVHEKIITLKEQKKAIEEELEQLEEKVKVIMKDAEIVTIGGRPAFSWKNTKPFLRLDTEAIKKEAPELYEKFGKETIQRRFYVHE